MQTDAAFSPADIVANPRKTTSVRRLGHVGIERLREAVLAIPEAMWDAENADKPNRFEALDRTRHIVFRFIRDFQDWRTAYDRPLFAQWRELLEPVLAQAVAPYGYSNADFPRVMLARMAPGGVIKPHRDANPAAKWPHKIHVPLLTNDKVTFFIDGTGHHFVEGEAVEVSNMAVHAVENNGDSDRIHLIFEYYDLDQPAPEWVGKLPSRK
jgi:hypothetical protein